MSRWTQAWLPEPAPPGDDGVGQAYRGERLGLPERGAGSVADFPARFGAIVVDWLPCYLVAALLTTNPASATLALFAALSVLSVGVTGCSPGHSVAGLRVATLDGGRAGFGAAVIRTLLICLLIPPLVYNTDGRGLHDRAAGTIVLRTR